MIDLIEDEVTKVMKGKQFKLFCMLKGAQSLSKQKLPYSTSDEKILNNKLWSKEFT